MVTMQTLEVSVLVDADGDYAIGKDDTAAREAYEQEIGNLNEATGFRLYHIDLNVPLPEPVKLSGQVPESAEPAAPELKVN